MIPINPRSGIPIYEQIKNGLRTLIVTGAVAPDEKLPSVRELAGTLSINPNTIQRSYRELEQEGYLYTVAGKGAFCADWNRAAQTRIRELLGRADALAAELETLGVPVGQLCEHLMHRGDAT